MTIWRWLVKFMGGTSLTGPVVAIYACSPEGIVCLWKAPE